MGRDVSALVRQLRGPAAGQPDAQADKPVLFVSCGLIEATAYVYRALVRGLQDRLPDMEVIGSDFVDFADPVRRSRVESILARAVATLVVVARDGVREGYASEEIALALQSGGRIIPVLLDGARMPTEDELPPAIRTLTRRNALAFDALHGGPEALTRLVERVAKALGAGAATAGSCPRPGPPPHLPLLSRGDRPRHTYRLRQDLADRFGPESTHTQLPRSCLRTPRPTEKHCQRPPWPTRTWSCWSSARRSPRSFARSRKLSPTCPSPSGDAACRAHHAQVARAAPRRCRDDAAQRRPAGRAA